MAHGLVLVTQPVSPVQAHMPTTASNALQPPTKKRQTTSVTVRNTTSEMTAQSIRDHATILVEHVTDQLTVIVTSVSTTPHGTMLTTVYVTPSGQEMHVKISLETVIQSAIKRADATDTAPQIVPSVSPMLIVRTTENVCVTRTGPERIAPSTQVSVTQSAKNVTALRTVTALSASATPIVMPKEPVAVLPTGQDPTVPPTTKAIVTLPVIQIKPAMSVPDLLHATALNALCTHPVTNITETVNAMMTGEMKTVNSTLEIAHVYAPAATALLMMNVAAVSLATTITDDSSENQSSTHITYVSANSGGQDMTVQHMLENATIYATAAGDQTQTNVTVVSTTPIKTPPETVNV